MYDLLIQGGRVVDGTGAPAVEADVAVQDGRIAALGSLDPAQARRTLDAAGRVVAPGLIDLHTHSDLTLLVDGDARSTVAQGVTTQVIGNCGISAAPVPDSGVYYGPLDAAMTAGLACDWTDLAGYLARLERQGSGTNVAALIGHGNVRVAAMGYADRAPTAGELDRMRAVVAQAMEEGAIGLSSGLAYAPGPYASLDELIELGKVVARYGGLYASHIRNQTEGIAASVDEVIAVGERAGLAVHVSHMQPGSPMLGATRQLLLRLDEARSRGVAVTCDAIPYTIGSTTLKSLLPPWACGGGDEALLARLRDPAERQRMQRDTLLYGAESGGSRKRNLAKEGRWDLIWLGSAERNRDLVGQSFAEIGRRRRQDPHDALLDILLEEEARPWMLAQDVSEEDFLNIARHPLGGVISDGFSLAPEGVLAAGKQHPRSFAAFPYFLRRFVRERGMLSWEQALHKLTGHPADLLGLHDRGRLRAGMRADLCVLDPQAVAETADFDRPYSYPSGVEHVLVNGEAVVAAGRLTGARPGQVLRRNRTTG